MAQQEGVTSLWNGTIPSLILVSNPAIQFMTYEAIKRRLHALCDKQHLSGLVYFFVGAVAKAVATVLTYPLQLVQTKLRVRDCHSSVSVHSGPIYESTFLEDTHHLLPPGDKFKNGWSNTSTTTDAFMACRGTHCMSFSCARQEHLHHMQQLSSQQSCLIFERSWVLILAWKPTILTDFFVVFAMPCW